MSYCRECKLLQFDGQKWTCPAVPYVHTIDMFTEQADCAGLHWYPKSIRNEYKHKSAMLAQYGIYLNILSCAVRAAKLYRLSSEIQNELCIMRDRVSSVHQEYKKEVAELKTELRRIS